MRIMWRRVYLVLPGLMLACSFESRSTDSGSSGGGCGGGTGGGDWGSTVNGAPNDDGRGRAPTSPAPTGQKWKPVETDEGCGRMGLTWVLVDEVCGDGEGSDDTTALHAPMFRDGALVGNRLFAVDATHLWAFDLTKPSAFARASLLTGLGTPLAVDKRGSELVLAAGNSGLVMVDTSAIELTRSRSIELAGNAFDVQVTGDRAYVAMGSAGIAEVDLSTAKPTVSHAWPIAGFSAGLATRGNYAYVASCGTFKVVDLSSGHVVAQTWVPNPIVKDRLVAPAKKVTLVGDVAFVAAGRYGAVAIDVSTPDQPQVLGNCTVPNMPSFYASGVRAGGDKLYVAGGEWGILPVDASMPKSACTTLTAQALPAEEPDISCSSKPPWDVVPWEKIWAPPPPGKDPIQTLPVGDRVYAFGDARRVGVRAVDVRNALDPKLPIVNRFDEPRMLLGVAATASRVVAVGPRGGVFAIGANGALTRTATSGDATLQGATAVTVLADGRWVALDATSLHVEGKSTPIDVQGATAIAASGTKVAVTLPMAVVLVDVDSGAREQHGLLHAAHLPLSVAIDGDGVYYAAPEWPAAARIAQTLATELAAHEVFDAMEIMDASLWRMRLPRRHLLATTHGVVEIAGVGPTAGLALHTAKGIEKVSLPTLTYAAAASDGEHVYLTGIDRSLYKSYLVSVDIAGTIPKVLATEAFTGAASGVAAAGGRVFVSDADGALRVYGIATNGVAALSASTGVSQ